MTYNPHEKRDKMLAEVGAEYGTILTQEMINMLRKDGFAENNLDVVTISGITIANMITHVLTSTAIVNERVAYNLRNLLIQHLQNSKEWL